MNDTLNLDALRKTLENSFQEFAVTLTNYFPQVVGAVAILLFGWILSKLVEAISRKVIFRMGLDRAAHRTGITKGLSQMGWTGSPSVLLSKAVYWILMLTFVLSAFETLGLRAILPTVDRLIAYIPNVIAAGLIILFAFLGGGIAGGVVRSGAAALSGSQAHRLGAATRILVIFLGIVLALEQLGVSTHVLVAMITTAVAVFGLSIGLSIALGSKTVVSHILAGHYLRQSLPVGQSVSIGDRKGTLERIGAVDSLFRKGEGKWTIPNARLLEEIVER